MLFILLMLSKSKFPQLPSATKAVLVLLVEMLRRVVQKYKIY